jgi:predicted MPP superfamily phosphohydrolase
MGENLRYLILPRLARRLAPVKSRGIVPLASERGGKRSMLMEESPPGGRAKKGISRRAFLAGGAAAIGGVGLGDAFLLEPRAVEVRSVALTVEKIPPGRELRLVHLSDLHIRQFHPYYAKVAETANRLNPDLILLTGDYLEESRNIGNVREFLKLLKASEGIFAVQGNWDYWARIEGENLRRHFSRTGTTLLVNQRHDLEVRGVPLSVLGLDYPSPADALVGLQGRADQGRINLLLSHVPAFAHELLDGRTDLILCGHTHGGQVRLPLVPPFYLPRFSGAFVAGLYHAGPHATPLYVTRGVGTSVIPVRFLCRPEITFIRLMAA